MNLAHLHPDDPLGDLEAAMRADLLTPHGLYEAIEDAECTRVNGQQGIESEPLLRLLLHIRDAATVETHHMLALRKELQRVSERYVRKTLEGHENDPRCYYGGFPG